MFERSGSTSPFAFAYLGLLCILRRRRRELHAAGVLSAVDVSVDYLGGTEAKADWKLQRTRQGGS